MKCGNCKGSHANVDEVRACCLGTTTNEPETNWNPAPAHKTWFDATGQSTVARADQATDRQMDYLHRLVAERDYLSVGTDMRAEFAKLRDDVNFRPSKSRASALIDRFSTTVLADSYTPDRRQAEVLPTVPAGHYAIASRTGNNDLDFFRVDRPTEGTWAGRTFVKRVIGGHEDQAIRGTEARQVLEAILTAGPEAAARLYGQQIGRCGRCNRHLTDETSRAYGLGPDCREKGW